MRKIRNLAVLSIAAFLSPLSWGFTPDLLRGCTVIAEQRKNSQGDDAIHAAYCLGVLDGIMTSTFQRQNPSPFPYPCFEQQTITPNEVAKRVVFLLKAKPELIEMARRSASDRGAMATYLAIAASYRCASSSSGTTK